jgi:sorting nexin-9/18/33
MEANVLFEFVAENQEEVSLSVGEIIKIIKTDSGDGWMEGINSRGEQGFFPAEYVQIVNKPGAQGAQKVLSLDTQKSVDDSDDWDNWNAESSHSGSDDVASVCTKITTNESFISGDNKEHNNVPEEEKVFIEGGEFSGFYYWKAISEPYTVTVDSPEKLSKYAGVKSFVAYRLTPSFNSKPILRRYKQFDWLHQRLTQKFYNIPIPPLPSKQLTGKYECTVLEQRTVQLQKFVNWISRHPVLSKCSVWMHFLTVSEEKAWKDGKRKAEKDQFVSAHFLATLVSIQIGLEIPKSILNSKHFRLLRKKNCCPQKSSHKSMKVKDIYKI